MSEPTDKDREVRALELFAGAGGAALGLHAAGVRTVARVEWDTHAAATLTAAADSGHLDRAEVICADVRTVDLAPWAGVDIMWTSPPCQAWSTAGDRLGADDDRNGWPWVFDAIDVVRPEWLIAENVVGMTQHAAGCGPTCGGCYLQGVVLPALSQRFAHVRWAILDAADYGVPQHRKRLFIVAGPSPFAWPTPTHGEPETAQQVGLFGRSVRPWRSIADALGHHGTVQAGIATSDTGARGIPRDTSHPAPTIGSASRLYYRPAPTLTGGSPAAGVRSYTVRECLLLMGWPEDYPLQGTAQAQYRQIGNGVASAVAEAVGRSIVQLWATAHCDDETLRPLPGAPDCPGFATEKP